MTSEFPVFTADAAHLEGEFVRRVLRTGSFIQALRQRASGTSGRKRITPDAFRDLRIPLPSLKDQRKIVAAHGTALDRAAALEREADETEARAMAAFEEALGLNRPSWLPERPVFAASYKDLDRWSHEAILRRTLQEQGVGKSPYPIVRLGDVIAGLENGWSPKCLNRPAKDDEWGVLKVSAASSGEYRQGENKALPQHFKPKHRLEVRAGDVLIARASGIARLVGVAAIAKSTRSKLLICDKIFRVVNPDSARADACFLAYALGIHSVRAQIEREFSTKSGMMKNVSKPALLALSFPLPPIDEQADMVASLDDSRAIVTELRRQAIQERSNAWTQFESAVYAVG